MESFCMDDSITENRKNESGIPHSLRHTMNGYRIAAAGLAGVLLAGNTTGLISASQVPDQGIRCVSGIADIAKDDSANALCGIWWGNDNRQQDGENPDGQSADIQSVLDWDENKILERWNLNPDDFPSDEEVKRPEIPDEYIPYFQEIISEAVSWYADGKPPAADLSKYSSRADEIRKAAAIKSSESLYNEKKRLLDSSQKIASAAGSQSGQDLISALQDDQYSRDVRIHSLAYGNNVLGLSGDDSSLMTAGKPVNDRTSGASSVSWFLSEKNRDAGAEEDIADAVLPPSFGCDTAPGDIFTYGRNSLPLPIGIYPYTGSYTTAADLAKTAEAGKGDHGSAYAGDAEQYPDQDGIWSEEHNYSGQDGLSMEEEKRDGQFIPFRYYRGEDKSGEFYGRRRIIFIGDSRTVGMEMSCGGKTEEYWSAEVSMGYNWMVNTGVPNVENLIDRNTDVVILMGVNDLGNVYRYVDYMNTKAAEWKELGARTFFVSVTPVDDRKSPNAKNSRIESFNAYAQENFQDVYYIDAYNRIRNSYGSPDGIHYDSATYREIYRIIEFSLYQGWYEQDGLWFYFDRGRPLTGWQYLDGQWQYMDGYGVRWIRDGRVGDRICLPLPDLMMTGRDEFCPVF